MNSNLLIKEHYILHNLKPCSEQTTPNCYQFMVMNFSYYTKACFNKKKH